MLDVNSFLKGDLSLSDLYPSVLPGDYPIAQAFIPVLSKNPFITSIKETLTKTLTAKNLNGTHTSKNEILSFSSVR
ncbi:hypothetical protein P4S72_15705 [Vibrio sp. PP-XX7]